MSSNENGLGSLDNIPDNIFSGSGNDIGGLSGATDEQYKKLIDALVDEALIDFTTELKDTEIHALSQLEQLAKNPLKCDKDFQLDFLVDYIKRFKINRIALNRQRAEEITRPIVDRKLGRKGDGGIADYLLNRKIGVFGK